MVLLVRQSTPYHRNPKHNDEVFVQSIEEPLESVLVKALVVAMEVVMIWAQAVRKALALKMEQKVPHN